jgi:penicillin-binding protein 1A
MAARKKSKKNSKARRILKRIGIVFLLATIIAGGTVAGVATGYMGGLPKLSAYKDLGRDQTSKIFAADGTLLATLHAEQDREIISSADIPKNLQHAAVAIEDERFYTHHGVDLRAILRALYVNWRNKGVSEGGSTLTQQYVRNSFIKPEPTMTRKIKEAALAYQLEQKYSKDKILEMYLNTVYFGEGCYGIESAALTYFGKHAKETTLSEAAMLAGLPGAPNLFDPYVNLELCMTRRNRVLDKMAKQKYITKKEADEAKKQTIALKPAPVPSQAVAGVAAYFVEHVKIGLIDKYGANMVYRGGMRVYTTLDMRMQSLAEGAVFGTLNEPGDPEGALVAVDPKTGYIKALVGGRDFNTNKFNLATQALRSPGSAFKPVGLAAALEAKISPNRTYDASSPKYLKVGGETWRVENYEGGQYSGSLSVAEATVWSVNAVYAQLALDVKAEKIAETAQKLGMINPVPPYPAVILGALPDGATVLEMASVYATLANDGVYNLPTSVTKITDTEGNLIEEDKPVGKQAVSPDTARTVSSILEAVISRGTGYRANIGRPAAGKTGTAEYKQDAWFCGYTPDLSCAVWMGYPEGSVTMGSVHGYPPYGGSVPALIWRAFMEGALAGTPPTGFLAGGDVQYINETRRLKICAVSGLLATEWCPQTVEQAFDNVSQEPKLTCNIHTGPAAPTPAPPSQPPASGTSQKAP